MLGHVLRYALAASILLGTGAARIQGAGVEGITVGEPFPLLRLPSAEDGEPVSIARFRGEKVVLHVFASW